MEIYTIGFAGRPAEEFFRILHSASVERLIDIRLRNTSQLSGFAKKADLAYFLRAILGVSYVEMPLLAPTAVLLDSYKKRKESWERFERGYTQLLESRRVEETLSRELFFPGSVLLCSERSAQHCHRRLAVDYLANRWEGVKGVHL